MVSAILLLCAFAGLDLSPACVQAAFLACPAAVHDYMREFAYAAPRRLDALAADAGRKA
jgi:hypothetical protein